MRRQPARGHYDRQAIHAILDEALVCHVGLVDADQPFVIPTIHARVDDTLYVHGSAGSRLIRVAASGAPLCITVTLLDALVLARSVFNHSMNYRSAVVLGRGRAVTDVVEKIKALEAFAEHIMAGRWHDARRPNSAELKTTAVAAVPISEASAKIRSGPVDDDAEDLGLNVWAGLLPLRLQAGTPIRDSALDATIQTPAYVTGWKR